MRKITTFPVVMALWLAGCVAPPAPFEIGSSAEMLNAGVGPEKIPVRAFDLESYDHDFELRQDTTLFNAGNIKGTLHQRKARALLAQDLRDYADSRFVVSPSAEVVLRLRLEQAYCSTSWYLSPVIFIPVVGAAAVATEGPAVEVTFIVEVSANTSVGLSSSEPIIIRVQRTETVRRSSNEKLDEVYRHEIASIRKELFERLDAQLLTLWKDKRFIGSNSTITSPDRK